jgi:hypothetical protein
MTAHQRPHHTELNGRDRKIIAALPCLNLPKNNSVPTP